MRPLSKVSWVPKVLEMRMSTTAPAMSAGEPRRRNGIASCSSGESTVGVPCSLCAVRIVPGSFGTFAGLATDARARVLGADDSPISGLYAVGNDQASVMGGHYPAGGINIGPAMTFGYIAAQDLRSAA